MTLQLVIVGIAAIVAVVYVILRMVNEWRRTQSGGCTSCPIIKSKTPESNKK